jgi:hypothetical protein
MAPSRNLISDPECQPVLNRLWDEMLKIHIKHPAPKTGKAAYFPNVSHCISWETWKKKKQKASSVKH